jgi:FHA domain
MLGATAYAQLSPLGEAKTDSFPVVTLRVHDRNPDARKAEAFTLKDGDKSPKFTVEATEPKDSGATKSVLILWEYLPSSARDAQNRYFRQLILSALPDILNDGDEINIATFAWTDPKKGGQALSLLTPSFSDNVNALSTAVTAAKAPGGKGIDAAHGSELFPAISEGIDLLATAKTKSKMLIVLSAEFPNIYNPGGDVAMVTGKAIKADVAVYNFRYKLMADKYNLDEVARNSYGLSYECVKDRNDLALTSLLDFSDKAVARSLGSDYAFTFTTDSPRDGKSHTVQITSGTESVSTQYSAPSLGFGGWIKANLVLFIVLIVLLLGAIGGGLWWMKKRNDAEAARQAEEKRKLEEVEAKSQATEDRVRQQNQQLNQIQNEEAERRRKLDNAQREAEAEQVKQTLLKEMFANGKQPRLTTMVAGKPLIMNLPLPVTTVGRDASCDVQIADQTISRTHFQVIYQNGKYMLLDLGSTNGTQLNGGRVSQSELRHGDQIKAGEAILFFYI